ncbi:MAG: hypothetical protein Q8S33_17085 [Myxococcales bacterium]|nr:hypothetical protein [Myxococcales bacterium]
MQSLGVLVRRRHQLRARRRTLRVPSPRFASPLDEELFFLGLRLAGQVRSFKGVGRFIEISVEGAPDRELKGLFERWRVEAAD